MAIEKNNDKEQKPKVEFWKFFFPYLKQYKFNILFSIICSIVTGITVSLQPLFIKYIVDNGINSDMEYNDKLLFVIIMCIAYIVVSLARVVSWRSGMKNLLTTLEGIMLSLRSKLFSSIQQKCMRFYEKNSSGELYNYIMGSPMGNIRAYLDKVIMSMPYQIVSFSISIVVLLSYNWILTIVMVAVAIIMILFARMSRTKIRNAAKEYLNAERETSKHMADMLNGISAVKIYSVEEDMQKDFNSCLSEYRSKGMKYSLLSTTELLKPEFVQYLGNATIYLIGAVICLNTYHTDNEFTTGMLFAFLSSMGNILSVLTSWFSLSFMKSAADTGLEKIIAVLDEKTTTPEVSNNNAKNISKSELKAKNAGKPCIEFKNVDFSYDKKPIFTNFSCKIEYGQSIGLVGSSGSGKSTFTKLILRLYETNNGVISIHGEDIKKFPTHELRSSFGVVPQSPFIFLDTVRNNIKITNPQATDEELKRAMDIARITDFIDDLPQGLDTIIGNGAVSLSGGQAQRVAIARAILKKPDILIFDEATSALDNRSEKLIQQAIEDLMKDHTVIIVAHRLSTVRNVDRILVFENGEILEDGSFDELDKKGGAFHDLLALANGQKTVETF